MPKGNEDASVNIVEVRAWSLALERRDLLAEDEILQDEVSPGSGEGLDHPNDDDDHDDEELGEGEHDAGSWRTIPDISTFSG